MILLLHRKIERASNRFLRVSRGILGILAIIIGSAPVIGLSADSSSAPDSAVNTTLGWAVTRPIDWDKKEFHIEQWTSNDGLPMSFIQCLAQTRDGHMWVGTEFGLARFSGRRKNDWQVFNKGNTPSFRDHNCISMAADSQGHLWIGTPSALYRVSEDSFEEFPLDKGFEANQVDRLVPLESGGLLIVRKERVQLFKNGKLETLIDEAQVASNVGEIRALQLIDDTEAWIGGARGLFRVDLNKKQWTKIEWIQNRASDWVQLPIHSFFADESDKFWIALDTGLIVGRAEENLEFKKLEDNLFVGEPWFSKIQLTSGNRVWYFNSFGGLYRILGGNLPETESIEFFEEFRVRVLLEDREGNIWIGTEDVGLIRLRPHVFRTLTREDGLIDNVVRSVSEDSKGRVWLGGQHTFASIDQDEMTVYFRKIDDWIQNSQIVYPDRQGRIWLAGQENLRFLMGDRVFWYADQDYKYPQLKSVTVLSILETDDNHIWVGTNIGLFLMPGGDVDILDDGRTLDYPGRFRPKVFDLGIMFVSAPSEILSEGRSLIIVASVDDELRFRIFDSKGHLVVDWSETALQPDKVEDLSKLKVLLTTFLDYSDILPIEKQEIIDKVSSIVGHPELKADWHRVNSGLPETTFAVPALHQDSAGTLWVGTESNGLYVKKGNESEFTQPKFLKPYDRLTVFCFLEDLVRNVLWIGTDQGILRVKEEETFLIRGKQGLSDEYIYQILEDDEGWLWISHPRGIYRVRRSDLDDVVSGDRLRVRSIEYGEADGIEVLDMQGGHQPAGCRTADGRLWFPSQQGVVVLDPKLVPVPEDEPRVVIQEVDVDGDVLFTRYLKTETPDSNFKPEEDPIVIPPGEGRNVKIRFSANAFHRASSMQYAYRMKGVDAKWNETDDGVANYTYLPPGGYTFRVRAVNGYSVPSSQDAVVSFFVKQRFYQTKVFYGGMALLAVILVWRLHRLRVFHREEIVRLEGSAMMERERARIARDMHDDIGASLTNIALMIDVVRNDTEDVNAVKTRLKGISSKARGLVDELSELVWFNNPRYDTLPDLISYLREYAAELFSMGPIQCELKFPESVPAIRVSGVFRRNLFLTFKESMHNIVKHSHAATVEILLELDSNILRLTMTDDGQGFSGPVQGSSDGLHNMKKRISDLRGSIHLESRPERGTRIRVQVPISEN